MTCHKSLFPSFDQVILICLTSQYTGFSLILERLSVYQLFIWIAGRRIILTLREAYYKSYTQNKTRTVRHNTKKYDMQMIPQNRKRNIDKTSPSCQNGYNKQVLSAGHVPCRRGDKRKDDGFRRLSRGQINEK